MRLSLHTDFALRLLMLLAVEPDRLHTIEDAAARYGISRNHLMKVALNLARGGYLLSQRGRGGGLRLARPPSEVVIGQVVRYTEDNFHVVECFDPQTNTCILAQGCRLKGALREAMAAFAAVLDRYTLADVVARPEFARDLLRPAAASGG